MLADNNRNAVYQFYGAVDHYFQRGSMNYDYHAQVAEADHVEM